MGNSPSPSISLCRSVSMTTKRLLLVLTLPLAAGLLLANPTGAADKEAKIGDRIANLTFKDIHYLSRSLEEFEHTKAFVLVFTTTTCPVVQQYFPTLKALDKDFKDKGVQFLAVNVGPDDSVLTMAAQAVRFDVAFPFVKDFDGEC